jgi:hypothetical protein
VSGTNADLRKSQRGAARQKEVTWQVNCSIRVHFSILPLLRRCLDIFMPYTALICTVTKHLVSPYSVKQKGGPKGRSSRLPEMFGLLISSICCDNQNNFRECTLIFLRISQRILVQLCTVAKVTVSLDIVCRSEQRYKARLQPLLLMTECRPSCLLALCKMS